MPGWQQLIIVMLLGCWVLPLSAQIYTWKDAKGQIHYSDQKPAQRPHKTVVPSATSVVPMGSNIQRGNNISQLKSDKAATGQRRNDKNSQRARDQKALAKKCTSYRTKIARLDRQLRAGYKAATGNRLRRQRREVSQKLSRECLLR